MRGVFYYNVKGRNLDVKDGDFVVAAEALVVFTRREESVVHSLGRNL